VGVAAGVGVAARVVRMALVATAPTAVAAPTTATATATTTAAVRPTLRLGARGSAVVTLQKRLVALHYFDVSAADGVFGQNTYHAVVAFQKVQGLGRDGIVGPATWAKLARPYVPAPRYPLAPPSLQPNPASPLLHYVPN